MRKLFLLAALLLSQAVVAQTVTSYDDTFSKTQYIVVDLTGADSASTVVTTAIDMRGIDSDSISYIAYVDSASAGGATAPDVDVFWEASADNSTFLRDGTALKATLGLAKVSATAANAGIRASRYGRLAFVGTGGPGTVYFIIKYFKNTGVLPRQ